MRITRKKRPARKPRRTITIEGMWLRVAEGKAPILVKFKPVVMRDDESITIEIRTNELLETIDDDTYLEAGELFN